MITKLDWIKLPEWVEFDQDYFVVSDIHGNFNKFKELMQARPSNTRTVILGDYTDGGYQNVKVLKSIYDKSFILLKGNHDIALYYTLYPHKATEFDEIVLSNQITYNHGGERTLQELQDEPSDFYEKVYSKMKTYHLDKSLLFVHSGVYPDNIKESLHTEDGVAMCLMQSVYGFHPVWSGEIYGYPKMKYKGYRLLVVHGHTPTLVQDCIQTNHICCDVKGRKLMALLFRRGKTANGVRQYICE